MQAHPALHRMVRLVMEDWLCLALKARTASVVVFHQLAEMYARVSAHAARSMQEAVPHTVPVFVEAYSRWGCHPPTVTMRVPPSTACRHAACFKYWNTCRQRPYCVCLRLDAAFCLVLASAPNPAVSSQPHAAAPARCPAAPARAARQLSEHVDPFAYTRCLTCGNFQATAGGHGAYCTGHVSKVHGTADGLPT